MEKLVGRCSLCMPNEFVSKFISIPFRNGYLCDVFFFCLEAELQPFFSFLFFVFSSYFKINFKKSRQPIKIIKEEERNDFLYEPRLILR